MQVGFPATNARVVSTHSLHQNIGSLAAYPFAPYLLDGLGCRPVIWIGSITTLAAVSLQSAAKNWSTFIGARYVLAGMENVWRHG